jgi:hypothetical protein
LQFGHGGRPRLPALVLAGKGRAGFCHPGRTVAEAYAGGSQR